MVAWGVLAPVPARGQTGSLVFDKIRFDAPMDWNSADGRSASKDGQWGHQEIQFPAPTSIPAAGTTFTMTLKATATVSNLATECEVHTAGFTAQATPGLHASAFSPSPGKENTVTVSITLKPTSVAPGATADLQVGCFS